MKHRLSWIILFGIALTGLSCGARESEPELHQKIAAKSPVQFPEIPDFDKAVAGAQPQKGIYSTWGLIFNQKKVIDTTVRVRGTIVDISKDCPAVTRPYKKRSRMKGKRERCDDLSVTIQTPDCVTSEIRVVGYHPYYHPHLKRGMELDVTGKYVLYSTVFGIPYAEADNGLIVADIMHGMGISKTGRFTTDSTEISEMIAKGEFAETPKH